MEKMKLTNELEAKTAIKVAIDKVFDFRHFEFIYELMLEVENKVEELWDISALEENCDSEERWCDSLREDTREYIIEKIKEAFK